MFLIVFWGLAALAVVLGIVISAEEYLTEKTYSSGSRGLSDGEFATAAKESRNGKKHTT